MKKAPPVTAIPMVPRPVRVEVEALGVVRGSRGGGKEYLGRVDRKGDVLVSLAGSVGVGGEGVSLKGVVRHLVGKDS